jgi:hypothetical protein
MRSIVFDTGPIISLTTNNLLWLLEPLKKKYKGHFHITPDVRRELIDRPLQTKKFKFEALQVMTYINDGVLEIVENDDIEQKTNTLLNLANNIFKAFGKYMQIIHRAEMSAVASSLHYHGQAVVVDERTTRVIIENPKKLVNILRHTLHTNIEINQPNLKEFTKLTRGLRMIRSAELVTVAYEMGLLNKFLANIPNPKKTLLESVLWGVKLQGCAISKKEVEQLIRMEIK